MGQNYLKGLVVLLIISLLANFYLYREFYMSQHMEKTQMKNNISAYFNELRDFAAITDSIIINPDDEQNIKRLQFQTRSMSTLVSSIWNYYSHRKMKELESSLISIQIQIDNLVHTENLKSKLVELRDLNNSIKDTIKYFDDIVSNVGSGKYNSDYLIKNQLEISKAINEKMLDE